MLGLPIISGNKLGYEVHYTGLSGGQAEYNILAPQIG